MQLSLNSDKQECFCLNISQISHGIWCDIFLCTKILLDIYLKFQCHWTSCILSGNHTLITFFLMHHEWQISSLLCPMCFKKSYLCWSLSASITVSHVIVFKLVCSSHIDLMSIFPMNFFFSSETLLIISFIFPHLSALTLDGMFSEGASCLLT